VAPSRYWPCCWPGAARAASASNNPDFPAIAHADYSRVQGAALLVNETMLGTMDERLGMDADARSTAKRV
jgi:hypothetical protein